MGAHRPKWICFRCASAFVKYATRCPKCDRSLTLVTPERARQKGVALPLYVHPSKAATKRIRTGFAGLDRLLSYEGGAIPGDSILLASVPGGGKTTLLFAACANIARRRRALYLTIEQDVPALQSLARKLGMASARKVIAEAPRTLAAVEANVRSAHAALGVIDSVNHLAKHEGTTVAAVVGHLHALAHETGTALVLTSHVNASGLVRHGPEVAHATDAVALLLGNPRASRRRTLVLDKSRSADTTITVEMEVTAEGFRDVSAASAIPKQLGIGAALAVFRDPSSGNLATCEVQALVSSTTSTPRKMTAQGISPERVRVLADLLSRSLDGVTIGDSVVRTYGPVPEDVGALDAALIAALYSSASGKPLPAGVAFAGEVGLDGALRAHDLGGDAAQLGVTLVGKPGKPLLDALPPVRTQGGARPGTTHGGSHR